ncbi:hypothetical protein CFN78_28160 [Amycolatopsis antarctica]|uniref:N-acetyltransferase domain-containing protein n=1 Tax=Amycolatopsis antarctica TaxID=1854586 RepID=A0A263CUV5_9PSEU|nr:GNAT family N-acetyltransferase [Amycolatopsis antarctica]OZM69900.1 hypothetical protein CFN78_28160 [Amycolatopsis antarctica]
MTYEMSRARSTDLPAVMDLLSDRTNWLRSKGFSQWNTRDFRPIMAKSIECGWTWILRNDGTSIATLTMSTMADSDFWTLEEIDHPAFYLSKLATALDWRGKSIGRLLVEWANAYALERGVRRLRWDVWRENTALQDYYRRMGAQHLRTVDVPGRHSGALFEWGHCVPRFLDDQVSDTVTLGPVVHLQSRSAPGQPVRLSQQPAPGVDEHGNSAGGEVVRQVPNWPVPDLYSPSIPPPSMAHLHRPADPAPLAVSTHRRPLLVHHGDAWRIHGWHGRAVLDMPHEIDLEHLRPGLAYQVRLTDEPLGGQGVALYGDSDLRESVDG